MKKIVAGCLVLAIAMSLLGCGKAKESSDSAESNPDLNQDQEAVSGVSLAESTPNIEDGKVNMYVTGMDGQVLELTIANMTDETISYNEGYTLMTLKDGNFAEMDPKEAFVWPDEVYDLEKGESVTIHCDLSYYGELLQGTYKICKFPELEAEFKLQ